ncbi:hypothetical protein HDU77_005620 [Chytriomyces hyalinus]|nr:hypothetical protein HDU77_005620 [Chytriomyces hyalinus]
MFGRKTTRARDSSPSPSPERQRRYPNTRYDDPIDQLPPPARRARTSPVCLAAGGLAATGVAFIMVALVLLSPFSSMPAFASIGFIRLESATTPASDGIQSAILTTWGYCTTASSDSTTTCLPATNLQMLGNYATNFTLSPQPLLLGANSYSITQALSLLPYKSNPVLIFTLPIIMSLLGLAVISCTTSLISFFLKRYTNVWVVCAKFSSTLNIVSFVALLICVAVAVVANESLASLAATIPGITVVKPYAGLALLAVACVFVLSACVATTYLFIVARREDAFEDADVELGAYNQPKSESMQGTVPRIGAEKGGRGRGGDAGVDAPVRAGSRASWDDIKDRKQGSLQRPEKGTQRRDFDRAASKPRGGPPDRARSGAAPDRERGGGGGGGGAGRGARNDRFSIRSSIQDTRKPEKKDAEVKGAPEEEPPKSDWGILRTVNGVAGGVYGYFAGGAPKAEEPEEKKVEKAPSKDAKNAPSRSGGRGDRRSSFVPPRSRSGNDDGRRRGDASRERRGGGGGGGGDRRGSPDRYRDRSRSRR